MSVCNSADDDSLCEALRSPFGVGFELVLESWG